MIGKMSEGGHGVGLIEGISSKPGERKMVGNVVTAEERLAIPAGQEPKLIAANSPSVKPDSHPLNLKPGNSVTAICVTPDLHHQPIKNSDAWSPRDPERADVSAPANTSSHQPAKPPPFPAKPPVLPGDPKSINHASTRMVNDDLLEESLKRSRAPSSRHSLSSLSPSRSQIAAAINGGNASSKSLFLEMLGNLICSTSLELMNRIKRRMCLCMLMTLMRVSYILGTNQPHIRVVMTSHLIHVCVQKSRREWALDAAAEARGTM
jgi:hypothetical protein